MPDVRAAQAVPAGMPNRVPLEEWANELLLCGKDKGVTPGSVAKASPNRAPSRRE
jgi:hypothetical protein